jgi:NADH dehydrogenase
LPDQPARPARPRVVIIGGGFGGIAAARALRRANVDITLIDRTNHFIFQPLLYQVATAALAPSDITAPIRWVLRRQRNTEVLLAEARDIDTERRVVRVDDDKRELPYDYLIVAPGARHHYFGRDDWEPYAPGLKAIEDASEIRRRFLLAYEKAEKTEDERERDEYLTFVIVGGGPTGVELSGAIPFIAKKALHSEFRRIDTRRTRVILVEAGPRILPSFPEELAQHAARDLADLGVEVRVNSMVTGVDAEGVTVGPEKIRARTAFWAAGNKASPLGKFLGAPLDNAGRVKVNEDLSVPGHPEIFAIGDLATLAQDGRTVPWVSRREPGGCVRGEVHHSRHSASAEEEVPLLQQGRPGDDRSIARHRGFRPSEVHRAAGVVSMVVRSHHVSRRIPQQDRGVHRVGVLVLHVSGGGAVDYRR